MKYRFDLIVGRMRGYDESGMPSLGQIAEKDVASLASSFFNPSDLGASCCSMNLAIDGELLADIDDKLLVSIRFRASQAMIYMPHDEMCPISRQAIESTQQGHTVGTP